MMTTRSRARESVVRALDALAGPPPEPSPALASTQWHFAKGALAVRAALWGLVLGALAPATTALDLMSGLAADGVRLTDSTDLGFFFGLIPLVMALVAVLLSWNHWPLRDLSAYRREMTVAMLAVGVVLLVELRAHGARVTSDEWDDAWLFVNGSLVIHVLLTYWLTRLAANDLTALHAQHAGWPQATKRWPAPSLEEPLAENTSRSTATLALGLHAIVWGVAIGTVAGAAAGTLVIPVLGTLVGAYVGAIYGLIPTVLGAVTLVAVISWRRDTDPAAVYRSVRVTLYALGTATVAIAWPFLHTATLAPAPWQDANLVRIWLVLVPTVLLLLRKCAPKLAATYVRLVGPAT